MEIPAEGGCFSFKVVDYEEIVPTRFQPGEAIKDYRYRIVEDGIAGEESQSMHEYKIYIVFAPNDTDHTKEYAIDVKIADDFYRYVEEHHHFGEWQTVWEITQPCFVCPRHRPQLPALLLTLLASGVSPKTAAGTSV